MSAATPRATLLFAHGGGFCKETWDPIIRRIKSSPLLQRVPTEFVTFDFPYHGPKRDNSVPVRLLLENSQSPRVAHPAQDMVAMASREVIRQVQQLNSRQKKTPLIGIAHSMGAAALWSTEVQFPGTFDGLILFEPVYGLNTPDTAATADFLITVTLQRESSWPSIEAAYKYFHELKNFARWDRESLAGYLKGALIEESDGTVSLACHPHIEAAFYCHKTFLLSEEEQARPRCEKITFHYGSRTKTFVKEIVSPMCARWPNLYKMMDPMPGLGHLMVLEDPALSAAHILKDLEQLAPFRQEEHDEDAAQSASARL